MDAKTKNDQPYKRNSPLAARSAFHRMLVPEREINLFKHAAFKKSNAVLSASLQANKKTVGEAPVAHKPPISDADSERIAEFFADIATCNDPRKYTLYVWYQVSSHVCLRGCSLALGSRIS
eukprot:scpid60366/ scgid34212/ 